MESNWSMKPRMASGVRVSKIILLAGTRMEAGAQGDAGFIERAIQSKAARGLGAAEERETVAGTVQAVERRDGNVEGLVLVAAEGGAEPLLDADDREFDAFDADDLVERRGVTWEQRGADGIADDGDEGPGMLLLLVKKRPSTTPISRMLAMSAAAPRMVVSSQISFPA